MVPVNKIILVGNLGRDPELRYTPQGNPVCTFSIATNDRRKSREGEQSDVTTWFRVTLFGKQAETASQYLTKGRPVYIEGRLRQEEWTDKEGKTRHTLEVIATDMQFIGGADRDGGERRSEAAAAPRDFGQGATPGSSTAAAPARPQPKSQPSRDEPPPSDYNNDEIPF